MPAHKKENNKGQRAGRVFSLGTTIWLSTQTHNIKFETHPKTFLTHTTCIQRFSGSFTQLTCLMLKGKKKREREEVTAKNR